MNTTHTPTARLLPILAGMVMLCAGIAPAFAADATHEQRYCERQFEVAQRVDMESFRDYDAEVFRAGHTEDAITVFASGAHFIGIDAIMSALAGHFQNREAVWEWTELYRTHLARVHSLVRRLSGGRDTDELTQDVFVRVWERAHLYDSGRGNFLTWLMGITRNTCIDQLRRLKARPQAAEPPDETDAFSFEESLTDPGSTIPEIAALNERAALVRRALAALTPEQRATKITHPERGQIDIEDLIVTLAGHAAHHLRQLSPG